jgi:hypothetical protein
MEKAVRLRAGLRENKSFYDLNRPKCFVSGLLHVTALRYAPLTATFLTL